MSENVLIVLIIVSGLVILGGIALYFLKDRLGLADFSANKTGVKARIKAEQTPVTSISKNKIKGDGNTLRATGASKMDANDVEGNKNTLNGQ
ncbi:hypothetical protein [Beggiatoa leptomitoformis]|uniref:Uncharacterized protein n=1 Tax=Beggiatoa leptomitoformis TaxID=288004 RepID=A0A2N9YC41_9GAMM|nr:hypothetical protein [Beggiatoa leptomitoformis]ALG66642.1 hypothetical protein AL038_01480 [Beggiatoa leptomitoformis]AUI68040.1 hypothetical protein BLE401_04540 [Beggiatoa leptomitoformis]